MSTPLVRRRARSLMRAQTGARPVIEGLEDRIVFSTFVVSLLTDTGPIDSTVTPLGAGTAGDLRNAIFQADQTPGEDHIIDLTGVSGTIDLQAMLPPIATSGSGSLTILGPGAANLTISGGNAVRNFFIVQGTVDISGLTIADGLCARRGWRDWQFAGRRRGWGRDGRRTSDRWNHSDHCRQPHEYRVYRQCSRRRKRRGD